MNNININIGSDGVNHHPLNNLTFEGGQMSNDIYNLEQNIKEWFKNHPVRFKKSKKFSDSCKGVLNPFYGKKHTNETKQFLSKKQTGVPIHSEKWKKCLSKKMMLNNIGGFGKDNGFYGKKHTEETRKIIKLKRAKQIINEETKEKMSLAHKKRWQILKLTRG